MAVWSGGEDSRNGVKTLGRFKNVEAVPDLPGTASCFLE